MGDMLPRGVQLVARNGVPIICAAQTFSGFRKISHGDRWLSVVLLVLLAIAWGIVANRRRGDAFDVAAVIATIGVGAWLGVLVNNGQPYVTAYAALFVAPFWYGLRRSLLPWACGVASVTFSTMFIGHHDIGGGLGNGVGALFFGLAALFWGRVLRSSHANAQLVEDLRNSRDAEQKNAVVAERARLARELHDVLAHTLSSLSLHLESTRVLAKSRQIDGEVLARIDRAVALARTGLEEARDAVGTLRDDALPSPEGIGELVAAFARDSGVSATYDETGEPRPLTPEARVALFRAAQEALTNVAKHADASRVEVRLEWGPASVSLRVTDDGRGAAAPSRDGGNGLRGMRERAELAGGEVAAAPAGAGFEVEVRLPVTGSAARPTAVGT
jgi:signal transduction histidine kinase